MGRHSHIILPRVKMKLFLVVGSFALLGQAYGQSSQGLNYLTPKPDCKWKEDWKQTCDINVKPKETYEVECKPRITNECGPCVDFARKLQYPELIKSVNNCQVKTQPGPHKIKDQSCQRWRVHNYNNKASV